MQESLAECSKAGYDNLGHIDLSSLSTETTKNEAGQETLQREAAPLPGFAIASSAAWGASIEPVNPAAMEAAISMIREQHPQLIQACRTTCSKYGSLDSGL